MKIILEREKCIGCGSCVAICPEFWEMAEDGKSHLKNSRQGRGSPGAAERDSKTNADSIEHPRCRQSRAFSTKSEQGRDNEELEVKKIKCGQDATDACPVQCIHIIQ